MNRVQIFRNELSKNEINNIITYDQKIPKWLVVIHKIGTENVEFWDYERDQSVFV